MIESQTHHQAWFSPLRSAYSTARQSADADILQALSAESRLPRCSTGNCWIPVVDAKDLAAQHCCS